jgi:DNA-binding transcriptional regulator YiaG
MGTIPQAVTNWFAKRKQPTAEQALAMLEILKNQRVGGALSKAGEPKKPSKP